MLSRNQIKFITSLQQKKFRQLHGLFSAEGERLVGELILTQLRLHSLYALEPWAEKNQQLIRQYKPELHLVSSNELERISALKSSNQVMALFHIPTYEYYPSLIGKEPLIMLDGIQDPGNLGTIIRTADWFGIKHIFCSIKTVEAFSPKTIQSTMGSIARVSIYYLHLDHVLQQNQHSARVFGAMLSGAQIHKTKFDKNAILLIGNEAHGISPELQQFITDPVYIPPFIEALPGVARPDSLNAGVAAAILCWEYRRISF